MHFCAVIFRLNAELREAAGIGTSDLFGVSDDEYRGADGTIIRREYADTPNGNPLAGRWVLRNPLGSFVSFDQYRNDIAEKYGLRLLPPNSPDQGRRANNPKQP